MALTAAQYTALNQELVNDPRGYGYAPHRAAGNDSVLAGMLNLLRDGSAGTVPTNPTTAGGQASGIVSINRGYIDSQELVEAIVQSEMPSNASQRDWLIMVASGERVRVDSGSTARTGLLAMFGAATATRANLTAASTRTGSRAEELFGVDVVIDHADVAVALRGG